MGRITTERALIGVLAIALVLAVAWAVTKGRDDAPRTTGTTATSGAGQHTGTGKDRGRGGDVARLLAEARPGDTIRLDGKAYGVLRLHGLHFDRPVTVVGTPGTVVAGMVLRDVRGLVFEDLAVEPQHEGDFADVKVLRSSDVTFLRVRFDGHDEASGTRLKIVKGSTDVHVLDSDFTACRHKHQCILPGGDRIEIRGNRIHDLRDADAIRGGGSDITIERNVLERALVGRFHDTHNDLIQILGGGPWRIAQNHFGQRHGGAAQVFLDASPNNTDNPIHDVTIESNLFTGSMAFAVMIAKAQEHKVPPPADVKVVNNTILSAHANAVRVGEVYGPLPEARRPVIANNVLSVLQARTCRYARVMHNVVRSGPTCGDGNREGNPRLDAEGRPTKASALLLDAADPTLAPPTDFLGRGRVGRPDIGAFEALLGR